MQAMRVKVCKIVLVLVCNRGDGLPPGTGNGGCNHSDGLPPMLGTPVSKVVDLGWMDKHL